MKTIIAGAADVAITELCWRQCKSLALRLAMGVSGTARGVDR
jgi:hypothetical protein